MFQLTTSSMAKILGRRG